MRFVSRAQWQARKPTSVSTSIKPVGVTIHWEGPRMGVFPHSQCPSKVRGIQAYHMDTKKWADVAYTAIVCPHGYVYECRGIGKRTAANGYDAVNDSWYAVCALAGEGDVTTPELLTGLDDAIGWLRANGAGPKVNGHRDHKPTACPGDVLYKWAHTGNHDGTTVPPPQKDTPAMFLAKDPDGLTQYLVDGGHVTALNRYLFDQLVAAGVVQITVQSLSQITESFSSDDEVATAMRRQLSVGGQVVEINTKVDDLTGAVAGLVAAPGVDEAAIAATVLEGLSPEAIAAAIPTDLAEQVADTLATRLTKGA